MIEHLSSRYTVRERVGSGATGELYRAHDQRLGRDVAVKVLRPELARDPERRDRLRREALLLAALDHPNIAAVHDLEEHDEAVLLVLEYVPGTTLAERVASGPLPLPEALAIARQIAEGLEAAHGQAVVHRDLKPANVILSEGGQAKILDFGLAKAMPPAPPAGDPWEPSTLTREGTAQGVLLGTVGYMSPEQARGQPLDRRTDIWAFGCVLYEMLTGRRAFRAATPTDTLVSILQSEPDWEAVPSQVPPAIRVLLGRCLTKDPRYRLRDIGEAWVVLARALAGDDLVEAIPPGIRPRRRALTWAGLLTLAAVPVALGIWHVTRGPHPQAVRAAFELPLPDGGAMGGRVGPSLAITADGSLALWVDQRGIWFHAMDSVGFRRTPIPLSGSDLEFSPDGRWLVGPGNNASLTRIRLSDGTVENIALAPTLRGVSWGPDDSLVYSPGFGTGLMRVSSRGGAARALTRLDRARGEVTHRWPSLLPDGRGVLFTIRTRFQPTFDQAEIALLDLRTGRRRTLLAGGTFPRYVPSGHILYARHGRLLGVPFDLKTQRLSGTPVEIVAGVEVNPTTGAAQFACSRSGTLLYTSPPAGDWTNGLAWLDHRGRTERLLRLPALIENPDESPDGRYVAFTLLGAQNDIAIYDTLEGAVRRLTFDPAEDITPMWSPDGHRLAFCSTRGGALNLYCTGLDAEQAEERLTRSPWDQQLSDWSPDGTRLLFTQDEPGTGTDLWILDLKDGGEPVPFERTPFNERAARFSPCGRWVAYESNETGPSEVYVRGTAPGSRRTQVSRDGGREPQWAPDGRELYYARGPDMMAATVRTLPRFEWEAPRLLFSASLPAIPAVSADGRRFLTSTEAPGPDRIVVRLGWFEELRRLAPRSR